MKVTVGLAESTSNESMRVLITGMGGQLGTLVARLVESRADVDAVVGVDLDPPRRRLHRAEFHWIRPGDIDTLDDVVRALDPTVVVHLGQFEPHARLAPAEADTASRNATDSLIDALRDAPSLRKIVVRSGIEVYGRRRGGAICPDETATPDPTSQFGRRLLATEQRIEAYAHGREPLVTVTSLRLAPVAGYHAPSPLARLLTLHAVPLSALSEPTFSLLHAADAADAVLAAVDASVDGPVNVVGPGVVSAYQAARVGGRVPVPVLGPAWLVAGRLTAFAGAPMPDHVHELIVRGRTADGGRCEQLLGFAPSRSTRDIVTEIFEQTGVEFLEVVDGYAA